MTSKILSPAPNLRQEFCEKSRKKVCFTDLDEKTRRKNTAAYRKLDKIPEIRDAIKSLVIDNDPEAERLNRNIPQFDWIRYLYHNNAILKNGTGGNEKSYKIIAWRRATLFLMLLYTESQRHGFCYAMTTKLLEILQNQGYQIKIRTLYQDIRWLESQGFIFRNSWKKTKYIGGGSVRHIITAYNVESYRKNYIDQLNIRGIGKPQSLKDRFSEYEEKVSKLLFCSSSADKNKSPQEYIYKYYTNTPLVGKTARKSRKMKRKRAREPEARVPDTPIPAIETTPWDPARLNDPQWVVQEAIHQGCDGTLARQIVEAIQLKRIRLKTNLLRATLHATKSKNQEYINAIRNPANGERKNTSGNDAPTQASFGLPDHLSHLGGLFPFESTSFQQMQDDRERKAGEMRLRIFLANARPHR